MDVHSSVLFRYIGLPEEESDPKDDRYHQGCDGSGCVPCDSGPVRDCEYEQN